MLDVFVGEALAPRALREPDPLAERAIVGFAVRCVKRLDRISAAWLANILESPFFPKSTEATGIRK